MPKSESEPLVSQSPKQITKPRARSKTVELREEKSVPKTGGEIQEDENPKKSIDTFVRSAADGESAKSILRAFQPESLSYVEDSPVEGQPIVSIRLRPFAKLRSRRREFKPATLKVFPPDIESREFNMEIKQIVEAILFAAKRPMTAKQVQQVFPELEQPDIQEIQAVIEAITEDYRSRPIELKQVASGYRFQVKSELSRWVSRLFEEKPPKYSRALLETLAIIAYRQPVTRGDIEDIRGVSVSSSIIQTLLEREWIRVVAHKEVPGRPGLYGTTKQFLDYFNIKTLDELPTLQEIKELDSSIDNRFQYPQVTSEKQETIEQHTETTE